METVEVAPAAAPDGAVFFGDQSGNMYALEKSGAVRWKVNAGLGFDSARVVSQGRVFVGNDNHHIYAFDIKTGGVAWAFKTKDVIQSTPIVVPLDTCPPPAPPPFPPPGPPPSCPSTLALCVCNPAVAKRAAIRLLTDVALQRRPVLCMQGVLQFVYPGWPGLPGVPHSPVLRGAPAILGLDDQPERDDQPAYWCMSILSSIVHTSYFN